MTQETSRLCGSRVFNSKNCHSKIRKVATNKFETIYLCGKHAFKYSVVVKNNTTNNIQEVIHPNRETALVAFVAAKNKYKE